MKVTEQGVGDASGRYQAVPRTLIFVTSRNPGDGTDEVLLLRGAPDKPLWANRYNGLGGHVEADEDILSAARRELLEEAGLSPEVLRLRGIININTNIDESGQRPGVLVFVFHAQCHERSISSSNEGKPEWIPVRSLQNFPLVDDLYEIVPRTLSSGPVFYGYYAPQPDGTLRYYFAN